MKKKLFFYIYIIFSSLSFFKDLQSIVKKTAVFEEFSKTYSKSFVANRDIFKSNSLLWEQKSVKPFTELIFSWNAIRPKQGMYLFYVSIFNSNSNSWSPWKKIVEWGNNYQRTFAANGFGVRVAYSRVAIKSGCKPSGFRIKAVALNGASILGIHRLYACLSNLNKFKVFKRCQNLPTIKLNDVPTQSQKVLNHKRTHDLCSPTSVGIVIAYLCSKMGVRSDFHRDLPDKIVEFSHKVHDDCVKIYGNWMLNTAQAYDTSHCKIFSRVERLNDFLDIYKYLKNRIPVVVSIRGIKGGATPYANGHLLVVTGWDKQKQAVCCIDPAFSSNSATKIEYNINDFLAAWGRSTNLAYVFLPKRPI